MAEIQTGLDGSSNQEGLAEEQARVQAAKAELYDEQQEQENNLILGKYETQEDLVEGYRNLQREVERMRRGEEPSAEVPETPETPEASEEAEPAEEDEPEVSSEDYERIKSRMFEQVGGEEKYGALMRWGQKNVTEEAAAAYKAALDSGDEATILTMLKGFQYDQMMSTGYEPKLTGGRAPSQDIQGFTSEAQVVAAMQDPRYGTDPAYVKEVEKRIAVSNVFNAR